MTDDELLARLAREMREKTAPLELLLQASSALHLAGLLQLARRHPSLSDRDLAAVDRFLVGVRAYFADCPAVLAVLERGDEPPYEERHRP